jgi:hypothetical protein
MLTLMTHTLKVCVVMTDFHSAVLRERMQHPCFEDHLASGTSTVTFTGACARNFVWLCA